VPQMRSIKPTGPLDRTGFLPKEPVLQQISIELLPVWQRLQGNSEFLKHRSLSDCSTRSHHSQVLGFHKHPEVCSNTCNMRGV
jgi:hypothetical protein